MRNPFIRYSPLEARADWVGQTDAFDALSDHIRVRNNVCILGVQGSGKTSLLQCFFNVNYIRHMAQEEKTVICKVDLSPEVCGAEICRYLAQRIRSTVRLALMGTADGAVLNEALGAENDADAQALLYYVMDVLEFQGYHVVLVMDRFESFTASAQITMNHHEQLRSLIEANKLRCIVATNCDLTRDSLPAGVRGSYLLQKFTNSILLKGMSDADAAAYIERQQADGEIQIPVSMIGRLNQISGGIPLLLEYAAECTYAHLAQNGGSVSGPALTAAIYERAKPVLKSWCSALSAAQIRALKLLVQDTVGNGAALYDFTGSDGETKEAVAALRKRGLLIAPNIEYPFEVRANSLLLQRYCREDLQEPKPDAVVPAASFEAVQGGTLPAAGTVVLNIEHFSGDIYQGNASNQSSTLQVQNMQINQGLSTADLLDLLCGDASGGALDSRGMFASRLSDQLRRFIPDGRTPLLAADGQMDSETYAQRYDEEFDKISQKIVCDVEVDEEEDLAVTPTQLQTLEERFAQARTRCRQGLTDALLAQLSDRCRFYMMLSVVVEDALELPGIQMDDYSPQLVLYGKALEQSLRDNFYELFHKEPILSVYNTYTRGEDRLSPDVFLNKTVNQTLIGNYTYMMSHQKDYLADLCRQRGLFAGDSAAWWENLRRDVFEARGIRNLADHADQERSPNKENLDLMCDLLFGAQEKGILLRNSVGKNLYRQLFEEAIPQNDADRLIGSTCRMRVNQVKTNGGLKGVTCEGGHIVNISPKCVREFRQRTDAAGSFMGKELEVVLLERKTQHEVTFFSAQIEKLCLAEA